MTPEKVKELKDRHGSELVCVTVAGTDCVFRKPTRTEFDRWFDQMQVDKANASRHARELAKACLVYPDEQGFNAAIDQRPALLPTKINDAICEMAGLIGGDQDIVKKL